MLKLIYHPNVVKYAITLAGLLFVAFFAWNMYPIGFYSGQQFLTDIPNGPVMLGAIAALLMGALVFIACFHKERLREGVGIFSRLRNDPRYLRAVKWFTWIVLAMEFCSVAFRWYLLSWSRVGLVLLAIGIVGVVATYLISLISHAVMNLPPAVAASQLREEAGRQVFEDGRKHLKGLSIGEKRRVAAGDASPIDNVRDIKAQEREAAVAEIKRQAQQAADEEAERERIADDENRRNQEFYEQMVAPPGSNGHSKRPANF